MKIEISGGVKLAETTNVLSIKVPEWLKNRVECGIPWLDEAAGGGFLATQVIMFTGDPGAGKTTVSLQLADAITGSGNICVFNGREESPEQTAMKVEKLGIKNGFIIAQHVFADKLLEQCDNIQKQNKGKHVFLIQDSLPTLDDGFYRTKKQPSRSCINGATPARSMAMLTSWAKLKHGTVLCINHVTKGGQFAGKNEIKHMIDAHLELAINKEDMSRELFFSKNRFGATSARYVVSMGQSGVQLVNKIDNSIEADADDEDEGVLEEKAANDGAKKHRKRGVKLRVA
jgi:DNA repair protein RadA/Sms